MNAKPSSARPKGRSLREFLAVFGPVLLLTLAGFALAYQFVEPAPPRQVAMATGSAEGAYYALGQRFRGVLAREGIDLKVYETRGSLENLDLLMSDQSEIDLAFVQGGTGGAAAESTLRALGSLYFEPLWVFSRRALAVESLGDLAARRLAIGPEGSGSRAIALELLSANDLTGSSEMLPLTGSEAARALEAGEIDAAFLVTAPDSPVVQRLLRSEDVSLLSFRRAEAYRRLLRFLSPVRLPEGVIDFEQNIPDRDVTLLAPAATLVVREDFHPALTGLLLISAKEIFEPGGLFENPGEFPSRRYLDFPLDPEARRFFEKGPPLLQSYLPFWAATLIDRLLVLLLPLVTLLIPLLRILPPTYRWRVRKKIYRWYQELETVEDRALEDPSAAAIAACLTDLDRVEAEVRQISVPLSHAEELYHLRLHLDFLRGKLAEIETASPASPRPESRGPGAARGE